MTSEACKAAYEALYPNATKRESEEEKRGYTEQCYTAEQIREAFEDGWEACVAIATEAESAKAEAQPAGTGWVSVEERLPEPDRDVLIANAESQNLATGRATKAGTFLQLTTTTYYPVVGVTHWQPLPPPPEPR